MGDNVIFTVWPAATVVLLSMAIVRYQLFDISVQIRRVVMYGASLALVTLGFVLVCFSLVWYASSTDRGNLALWVAGGLRVGTRPEPCWKVFVHQIRVEPRRATHAEQRAGGRR